MRSRTQYAVGYLLSHSRCQRSLPETTTSSITPSLRHLFRSLQNGVIYNVSSILIQQHPNEQNNGEELAHATREDIVIG